jgi:hypothetical protein
VKEREKPSEDVLLIPTSEFWLFLLLKREKRILKVWPMMKSPEDWDPREHPKLENISKLKMMLTIKNKLRFWSENSPSEELGNPLLEKRELKLPRSKELLLNPDWETRESKRKIKPTELSRPKRPAKNTRNSWMNGDKEKLPRSLPILPERNLPWIKLLKRPKPLPLSKPLLLKKRLLLLLPRLLLRRPLFLLNNLKRNEKYRNINE